MAAHYGPAGPVKAAGTFTRLILEDGDLRGAWPLMDPVLRLVAAQAWLWANRTHPSVAPYDRDEAAAALADLSFDHALWPAFEDTQLAEFRRDWAGFNHTDWG